MAVDKSAWIKACFSMTFVVSPFSKLVFHLWLTQPPQFQFLSQFYFPPDLSEHHIHQHKTMLTHYCFTGVYFHKFKCYKQAFPYLETSIHQTQPFANCPIPPLFICSISKLPWTSSKLHISLPIWPLKSPPTNTSLVTTLSTCPFHFLMYQSVDKNKIWLSKLHLQWQYWSSSLIKPL